MREIMEILSLGEKIKRKRKELGMTLKDLAGNRITTGQISLIESGKSNPSMDLLEYLSKRLNVSLEYIIETEESQAKNICKYYENIAQSYIIDRSLDLAEKSIEEGLYYAEKYNIEISRAKLLFLKGKVHYLRHEETLAQQFFLTANSIFIKNNCFQYIMETFIELGKSTLNLKSYNASFNYFKQAEKVYIENNIKNEFIIGTIYYYLSLTYFKLQDIKNAIDYTYLAKEKFIKIDDKKQYAKSLILLSREYSNQNQASLAIKYSKMALDIYKQINDLNYIASIENSLGKLFYKFGNLEESFIHLNKAKKIRQYNNDEKIIETLIDICENYIQMKNLKDAEKVLNEAYEKIQEQNLCETDYDKYLIKYYLIKYKIFNLKGDLSKAEQALIMCLNSAESFDMKREVARISVYLGKFYLEHNRNSEASEYLAKGVESLKQLGLIKDL